MKKIILFFLLCVLVNSSFSQELQARLTVVSTKVGTQVDKKVFLTLQSALSNFLNNRKWTSENFLPQEKIQCNFLINIDQVLSDNVYKASLTVQAARPIYNTIYQSPILNFQDNDLVFKYIEFQPIEFNENRIQGADPIVANLTAVLAYYANIILGLDYDSFSPRGGDPFFQKAFNIVNNAPEAREISGWKPFDGMRNRFRLTENFTDNRFNLIHEAVYSYYRQGLDKFYEKEDSARTGVLNALKTLNTLNQNNPNLMSVQMFFQGKSTELVNIFSKGDANVKAQAREYLSKLDVTNAAAYKEIK
ncbi:DUF4835 family protein [Chitinophagaceae bacterium LB-8]|uniref:DUF4835 family protein n=1 Tax=Paraflavisolibacter caeni TaxID=2982496 RepID=A0A9X2XT97_9BACT|nr:DUF4835 family protein [Paraflavisolibacter caeni]MCU7548385.1 DUF4835 family protein [Paraflavisolibacter caeni]